MPIDLYYAAASAPCRAVQLTAAALGVELNLKNTNLMAGEHLTPEFIKMNPQHTIPTINDNGFCLWDSHAIIKYLVSAYGKDDKLYPKDPKKSAIVDQRLFFDASNLYFRFGDAYYPVLMKKEQIDSEKEKKFEETVQVLDTFLSDAPYVAGSNLTIADLSIVATVSTFEVAGVDIKKYPNVQKWYERMQKEAVGYDLNVKGIEEFRNFFKNMHL